jgi:general stress protein 26
MQLDPTDKRDDALSFLVAHTLGVLATVSDENTPHARSIYYTCDDSFNVYFITLANTRKVADLKKNPHAAFDVSEHNIPRTIQMEGIVTDLTDTATIDATLSDLVEVLMSQKPYGIPLARFDSSKLNFFRLTPTWVRWGDFTVGTGTKNVLTEVEPKEDTPQESSTPPSTTI